MSSKRKCIVILLFIVIVSILFILYNRSQFSFGIYNHCTYSVYKLHSKSFKNHSNFVVNRDRAKFFQKYTNDMHRIDTKLRKNATTEVPLHLENSLNLQKYLLTGIGMNKPRKFTKYKECPTGRILTLIHTENLGDVILEYMSMIAVEDVYSDHLNMQAFLPGHMKDVLETVFESVDTPQLIDLPDHCVSVRHAQLVNQSAKPRFELGAPYDSPIILNAFSCRSKDIIRHGLEYFRETLMFKQYHVQSAIKVLLNIKENFGFQNQDEVTFVGVHYRGGYSNTSYYKDSPSFRFYKNGMHYFNTTMEKVVFVFISTEKKWLDDNISQLKVFNVAVNPSIGNSTTATDLILLSLCNHSLFNYGTYGTAAALFAGGTSLVFDTKLPHYDLCYAVASSMIGVLRNWFLCDEIGCSRSTAGS